MAKTNTGLVAYAKVTEVIVKVKKLKICKLKDFV